MARRAKQFSFKGKGLDKPSDCFGGSLLKGSNPKTKRPLESRLPIHLILRAQRGGMRLPKTFAGVNNIVFAAAAKHGIKIYKFANVGNHLHIVIKISSVRRWPAFIRELSGRIAYLMRELKVTSQGESFWLCRPYTRIINGWKRAFKTAVEYVHLNTLQAEGFVSRRQIRSLKDLQNLLADL